jgi:hypothetical protein
MAISSEDWQRILREHQFRCFFCARQRYDLTKDHMQPRSRGGADVPENIVPSCHRCNAKKRTRTVEEYWPFIDHTARREALALPVRDVYDLEREWREHREGPSPIKVLSARRLGGYMVETVVLERWGPRMGPETFMVYAAACQCGYQQRHSGDIMRLTGLPRDRVVTALEWLESFGLIAGTDDGDIDVLQAADIPDEASDAG